MVLRSEVSLLPPHCGALGAPSFSPLLRRRPLALLLRVRTPDGDDDEDDEDDDDNHDDDDDGDDDGDDDDDDALEIRATQDKRKGQGPRRGARPLPRASWTTE